jgi:hypothetical protein
MGQTRFVQHEAALPAVDADADASPATANSPTIAMRATQESRK